MQLTLRNFRYHRNATFTIPQKGVIRIKGINGKGKSTILNAIYFAFYGKVRKPFTHNSKTCGVSLDYPRYDLQINRLKSPSNRLTVTHKNKQYEDDNAQAIIDHILGMNYAEFYASSYFDQRKQSSILSMTPADQLSFIETIAFENSNSHEEKKNIIKAHVKSLRNDRVGIQSQLILIHSQIDACKTKIDKQQSAAQNIVEGNHIDPTVIKEQIAEHLSKLREYNSSLKSTRMELKNIQQFEAENRKAEDARSKLEEDINSMNEKISQIGDIKTENEINELTDKLSTYNQKLCDMRDILAISLLQSSFEDQQSQYFSDINSQIVSIQETLPGKKTLAQKKQSLDSYEKLKPLLEEEDILIKNYEETIKSSKLGISHIFNTVTSDFDVSEHDDTNLSWDSVCGLIKRIIERYEQQCRQISDRINQLKYTSLSCPKCKTSLCITGDDNESELIVKPKKKMVESDNLATLTHNLSSIRLNISVLQNYIENGTIFDKDLHKPPPARTENTTGIQSMKEYKLESIKLKEHIESYEKLSSLQKILKSKTLPSYLLQLKSQIKTKKEGLPKNLEVSDTIINDLESSIKVLEKEIANEWQKRSDHSKHSRELKKLNGLLQKMGNRKIYASSQEAPISSHSLRSKISELENNITEFTEELTKLNAQLSVSEDRSIVQKSLEELENYNITKDDLELKLQNLNDRIEGAEGLEKAAIDAEFLALERTIGSINEHAKIYLSHLFDLPIVAKLRVKKTTKKGDVLAKPMIDVHVEYKGEIYDDVDEFSGGERQKCDLAFLFAVNDMLGSNILMLDECFNNVDDEGKVAILECIRSIVDLCGNKQVIVITPRVEDGLFDEIVEL